MDLTTDQESVLASVFRLSGGAPAVPVTISAIHHTFRAMDVSDLVGHLLVLLDRGLIENYRPTTGRIGNTVVLTHQGILYCSRGGGGGC